MLASNPTFAERARNGVRLSDALPHLDTSAAGCLYWRAQNLAAQRRAHELLDKEATLFR